MSQRRTNERYDKRLKQLVYWPEREKLRKTMPLQFSQSFGLKVAIIIECFEIFIEHPSNLMTRAQTWSQYKQHIQLSIGITTQGSVYFLSKSWGATTSDKHVTNNELRCSSDWMVQMSNIFTYFTVSLPFSSRDVSIAISNLLQTTTARWRHGSHSTQTSLLCVPPAAAPWVALQEITI